MRGIWLLVILSFLVTPTIAVAQTTEPVGTVSSGDDEVFRAYDNPDVYFDATASLFAFVSIYDNETAASRNLSTTPEVFVASLRAGATTEEDGAGDYAFGELEDVEISPIGDESSGSRLPFVLFESFDGEYGIVVVRQGTWVQVLIAFGVGEVDVIAELEGLATSLQPHWPLEEPIAVREDGLRTGGIWNMMPMPEDLPEGFVVDAEFEEGPAATVDAVAPVGTRVPDSEATPVTADAGATPVAEDDTGTPGSRSDRQVPLIPTQAPVADTPETQPIESTPPPTAEPAEPIGEPDEPVSTVETTPAGTAEPTVEPEPTEDPEQIIAPIPATTPTPEPTPGQDATDPAAVVATPPMKERLAQPFDASVEIIIGQGNYGLNEDGSCSGSGLVDTLAADGELVLRGRSGDTLATATITSPGMLAYDTVLQQDVCYMTAQFADVPARAQYVLVAGNSVIGRFSYEELASGEPALVVIGTE